MVLSKPRSRFNYRILLTIFYHQFVTLGTITHAKYSAGIGNAICNVDEHFNFVREDMKYNCFFYALKYSMICVCYYCIV